MNGYYLNYTYFVLLQASYLGGYKVRYVNVPTIDTELPIKVGIGTYYWAFNKNILYDR